MWTHITKLRSLCLTMGPFSNLFTVLNSLSLPLPKFRFPKSTHFCSDPKISIYCLVSTFSSDVCPHPVLLVNMQKRFRACLCMYVCAFVQKHMHACACRCMSVHIHMHSCLHMWVHVCVNACVYMWKYTAHICITNAHVFVCGCGCICVCVCGCAYVCMHVCLCACVPMLHFTDNSSCLVVMGTTVLKMLTESHSMWTRETKREWAEWQTLWGAQC